MASYKIEDFVNTAKSIEKISNPTIDNLYKKYTSTTVSDEEEGFIGFLKRTHRCPFADNWNIVFEQCFNYWMASDCNVWNHDILYNIMCIVTKEGHLNEYLPT